MLSNEQKLEIVERFSYDYEKAKDAKVEINEKINESLEATYGKRYGNEKKNKSKIVLKEIGKKIELMVPEIVEPFVESERPVKVSKAMSTEKATIVEEYLNDTFNEQGVMDIITDIANVKISEGTVWVKAGWDYKGKSVEIVDTEEVYRKKNKFTKIENGVEKLFYRDIKKNVGSIDILKNEDVFPDPGSTSNGRNRFVAIRTNKTLGELKRNKVYDQEEVEKIRKQSVRRQDENSTMYRQYNELEIGQDESYNPIDVMRQSIELIEYWGWYDFDDDGDEEIVVAIWDSAGRNLIRFDKSPIPLDEIPIFSSKYSNIPFSQWGNSLHFFLGDDQKIKSGMIRGILDNMSISNNGQRFIAAGAISPSERIRMNNGERDIEVKSPESIQFGSYNQLPASFFNVLAMIDTAIQEIGGGEPRDLTLSKTDFNNENKLTGTQRKTQNTVRSISSLLEKVMLVWIRGASVFLSEEQQEEYAKDEMIDVKQVLGSVKRGKFSVKIGTSAHKQYKAREINLLLQQSKVLEGKIPDGLYRGLIASLYDIFDLENEADELRAYVEPEPTDEQKIMQNSQIEESLLKVQKVGAEVEELQSRARARSVEAQTKSNDSAYKNQETIARVNHLNASAQEKNVSTALKPVQQQLELDKINREGDKRGK